MHTTEIRVHCRMPSGTPGRLRLRFRRPERHGQVLHKLQHRLRGQPGINHVEVNARTGSVLV